MKPKNKDYRKELKEIEQNLLYERLKREFEEIERKQRRETNKKKKKKSRII